MLERKQMALSDKKLSCPRSVDMLWRLRHRRIYSFGASQFRFAARTTLVSNLFFLYVLSATNDSKFVFKVHTFFKKLKLKNAVMLCEKSFNVFLKEHRIYVWDLIAIKTIKDKVSLLKSTDKRSNLFEFKSFKSVTWLLSAFKINIETRSLICRDTVKTFSILITREIP